MADQATVKTNGPAGNRLGAIPASAGNGNHAGPGDMVSNVAEFGENLLSLAELQGRLTLLEMKQNVQTARLTAPVILEGAVLGIASLPILLAGIAELLVSELGMKRGLALLASPSRRSPSRERVSRSPAGVCVVRPWGSRCRARNSREISTGSGRS